MPPSSRHLLRRHGARLLAASTAVLLLGAPAGLLAAPAGGAAPPQRVVRSSLSLTNQTAWVGSGGTFSLGLRVQSPLPASRLGLEVIAYSKMTTRPAFSRSLAGNERSQLPLPGSYLDVIRLGSLLHRSGTLTLRFKVAGTPETGSSGSRTIPLATGPGGCAASDCDGVYPVEVNLVDTTTTRKLASFTTHLIYVTHRSGALPLRVALVIPLGANAALGPNGSSMLSPADLHNLSRVLGAIAGQPGLAVSLELHGELLAALAHPASPAAAAIEQSLASLAARGQATGRPELLSSSFAPVDIDSLVAEDLPGELRTQLERENSLIRSALHLAPPISPWVSGSSVGPDSLAVLSGNGIHQVVLPASSLSGPTPELTQDAPFVLTPATSTASGGRVPHASSGETTVGLQSDSGLNEIFRANNADPQLASHQFLAELAQIYFEEPFAPAARGVVVAPAKWTPNAAFLAPVLKGLAGSPILTTSSLADLFQNLTIGANGEPASYGLAGRAGGEDAQLSRRAIEHAYATVGTVSSVLGHGPASGVTELYDSILLAEASGISPKARRRYLENATGSLSALGRELELSGTKTVTLTSRDGKVPITVKSSLPVPLTLLLELKSSKLTLLPSTQAVRIERRDNPFELKVATRTSGEFNLTVELVSPTGGAVLVRGDYVVRSTAVSSVAVVLSLGALAVLLGWWIRSYARNRRRLAEGRSPGSSPAPV